MIEINLIRRYKNGNIKPLTNVFKDSLKGIKGIKPELCPAIRDFQSLGWGVSPPVNVVFRNERSFDVEKYSDEEGNKFLVPGVIGDKVSKRLYARIDTGFSMINLPVPILALKCQNQHEHFRKFEIAPVVYPRGYSGPVLIAASANEPCLLRENEYVLQMIPMIFDESSLVIRDDSKYLEKGFEGLFKDHWDRIYKPLGRFDSRQILNQ
jgi:hypothetical protein